MPYDTNGNYSLPTIYYAISGTVINPSQHNTPLEDVRSALNQTLLRNGAAAMTGNLNAGGNKITCLKKGANAGDAATFDQLSGYLSLSTGGNITGNVTINGNNIVSSSGSDHSNYITQITYETGVSALGFEDGAGTWRYAQPYGSYATTTQLSAETQRATTIESNLQSSKANIGGGNQFSGDQTVNGNVYVGVGSGWSGSTTSGNVRWGNSHLSFGSPDGSTTTYTGCLQITDLIGSPGDDCSGINMFGYDYSGQRYDWRFGWNGNIQTPKGSVAFQSDLANYQPKGDYAPASSVSYGTITGGTYTKIGTILRQCFVVSNVVHDNTGTWVNYPMALSNANNVTIQTTCNANADMDTFAYGQTATGFYINIPYRSGSSNNSVFVTVEGYAG